MDAMSGKKGISDTFNVLKWYLQCLYLYTSLGFTYEQHNIIPAIMIDCGIIVIKNYIFYSVDFITLIILIEVQ